MISQTSEYIIRALIYLAENGGDRPILSKEIASETDIPKNYLSKLLFELKRAGFVEADRGKTGGYRLAKAPEKIKISDIVYLFDGEESCKGCFLRKSKCTTGKPCPAHGKWNPIGKQIREFLETTSIKELSA